MRKIDLTGRRFGRLLVLRDSGMRSGSSVIWCCRCDCGTVKDISSRDLLHRGTVSCGCYRRERSAVNLSGETSSKLGQIDGTNVSRIRSDRPQVNNRTGYRGVSWVNYPHGGGAYLAAIYFRGRRYRLGFYPTAEEASKAYLSAKANIHGDFITWYDQYKEDTTMKEYKVYYGIREIKSADLCQMDEDSIFDLFLSGDYANDLILTTDSRAEALELLSKKRPTMRVGSETMYGKRPVSCVWIEEYEDGEYAGTMEHSAWKGVSELD